MRRCYILLLVAVGTWLGGCGGILSEQPLGDEIAVFNPADLDGMWLGRDWQREGTLIMGVRVLDAEKGLLVIWGAASYPDDAVGSSSVQCSPPPEAEHSCSHGVPFGTCVWRHYGRFYFPVSRSQDRYVTIFTILRDGKSTAVVYEVPERAIHDQRWLVEQGLLPGRIEPSGDVVLGELSYEHYRLILSEKSGIFSWQDPMPYLKLPPELDPCKKADLGK